MPFCPQCQSELNKEVLICTDSRVELVSDLPPEDSVEYVDWGIVQSVSSEVVGNNLKVVMGNGGIEVVLRSHHIPCGGGVQGDFVNPDEFENARDILESYLASLPSNLAQHSDTLK